MPASARFGKLVPVVAFFVGMGGLWASVVCINGIVRSNRASRWSTTDARVVVSHLVAVDNPTDNRTATTTMRAEISYQYQVGDRAFQSNVVNYFHGQIGGGRQPYDAKMHDLYSAGQIVRISYDPANPSDAVIDSRTPTNAIVQLVAGSALFLGDVLYLIRFNVLRRANGS